MEANCLIAPNRSASQAPAKGRSEGESHWQNKIPALEQNCEFFRRHVVTTFITTLMWALLIFVPGGATWRRGPGPAPRDGPPRAIGSGLLGSSLCSRSDTAFPHPRLRTGFAGFPARMRSVPLWIRAPAVLCRLDPRGNRGRYPIFLLKRSLAGGRLTAEPVGRPKKVKDKPLI